MKERRGKEVRVWTDETWKNGQKAKIDRERRYA